MRILRIEHHLFAIFVADGPALFSFSVFFSFSSLLSSFSSLLFPFSSLLSSFSSLLFPFSSLLSSFSSLLFSSSFSRLLSPISEKRYYPAILHFCNSLSHDLCSYFWRVFSVTIFKGNTTLCMAYVRLIDSGSQLWPASIQTSCIQKQVPCFY